MSVLKAFDCNDDIISTYGNMGPGLKTVVQNDIFWSEIELGFGEPAITRRYTPSLVPRAFPLKNGWGGNSWWGCTQPRPQGFSLKKWVVFKGKALGTRLPPPISQLWRIIVIYILISFSFLFWVVRHFRLSLLNNFYCEIFSPYNIVIRIINSVTSVNLKKAGMASQNIVINKTLSERTLRRRCTKLMWGFFMSGTCECRNVVNQGLVEMGEKGDVEP